MRPTFGAELSSGLAGVAARSGRICRTSGHEEVAEGMLVIRKQLFTALERMIDKELENRIVVHVWENHQRIVNTLPRDLLHDMVRNGISRARRHGLRLESSLTAFVSLMFEISPTFDEHPEILRILEDNTVEPDKRIELLLTCVSGKSWEEAGQRYNEVAWFMES